MFTGIIETIGTLLSVEQEQHLTHFSIQSPMSHELKVDQSVAHDGVCLTVTEVSQDIHRVTAVAETLSKTNLSQWKPGRKINLERALKMGDRLDGHIVQGHVDTCGKCTRIATEEGNRLFEFSFDKTFAPLVVEKGSVCVNGVSLTAFAITGNTFTVSIIPYTFNYTNFESLTVGHPVNIEFDLVGKYLLRNLQLQRG
jgi:riboflavin synthase